MKDLMDRNETKNEPEKITANVPSEGGGIKQDGPGSSDVEANSEEHDHGAFEFVSDGVPANRDPGKQDDDVEDVEGFEDGGVCGDAGHGGVGEDVDPEAQASDENEYLELEAGEEGH
jgi:hypothetical protein